MKKKKKIFAGWGVVFVSKIRWRPKRNKKTRSSHSFSKFLSQLSEVWHFAPNHLRRQKIILGAKQRIYIQIAWNSVKNGNYLGGKAKFCPPSWLRPCHRLVISRLETDSFVFFSSQFTVLRIRRIKSVEYGTVPQYLHNRLFWVSFHLLPLNSCYSWSTCFCLTKCLRISKILALIQTQ